MSDIEKIQLFESKRVRTLWVEEEDKWYFVLEDVIGILTESTDPKQYIKRMKLRDPELAKGWVQIVPLLSIQTDGGPQKMRCANLEGMFRIIQSIPSKKAEPFKRWMALEQLYKEVARETTGSHAGLYYYWCYGSLKTNTFEEYTVSSKAF